MFSQISGIVHHKYDKALKYLISEKMSGPGFVGIRFCQECNNMLYPKVGVFLIFSIVRVC